MQMQLALFDPVTNVLIADWSTRVLACTVRTSVHGYESCEAELNIPFYEAFLYYQQLGPLKLRVTWGSYRVWEGRLEDPTQFADVSSGLKVTAFGGWVAYNDAPYTSLWSDSKVESFRPVLTSELAARFPDRFHFDTQNRIFISPDKGSNQGAGIAVTITSEIPDGTSKFIEGVSFDYAILLPAGYTVYCSSFANDFTAAAVQWSLVATGVVQVGSINIDIVGAVGRIAFEIGGAGAAAAFVPESGSNYFQVTNFRMVAATTNRINTTLGTNIAAGTQTVTPASMARIYVGQRLFIDQGSVTVGESVLVTAITATTFTAVFVFAHVIASTVTAHFIAPDEIIKDCVTALNTLNATQVSNDVLQIQSQAIDIDQAVFEDVYPAEIINQLIAKSDNQTPPRQWVAMVYDNQQLIVRPRGTGLAWYADVTSLEIVRTLTQLYNSVYAVYSDSANKRKLRTASNTDVLSVAKFQLTRRKAVQVDTTNATQALKIRDSILALQTEPIPRASIEIDRVFDAVGTTYPLWFIRADDTLTIRNLPPALGSALYDKIKTLVITRTDVDLLANTIKLELEIPMPDLSVQIANLLGNRD